MVIFGPPIRSSRSCGVACASGLPLPQLHSPDLARLRPGEPPHELDLAWVLEARALALDVLLELADQALGPPDPRPDDDEGLGDEAPRRGGRRDDGRLGYRRVFLQYPLHLGL